ncbi:hypothetical protein ACIQXD_29825 [Streptomyces uncialis]|uniref:hypothetical protein n=1 Tax=Streptomyces uncialis TaxID=1048205 RepID=UPI00381D6F55
MISVEEVNSAIRDLEEGNHPSVIVSESAALAVLSEIALADGRHEIPVPAMPDLVSRAGAGCFPLASAVP